MTGPEHYKLAEHYAEASVFAYQRWATGPDPGKVDDPENLAAAMWQQGQAQVHALLALTAAYAADAIYRRDDRTAWDAALGRPADEEITR